MQEQIIESGKEEIRNPLTELSKATISILVAVILLLGGTSGGIVSKVVTPTQAQGISQEQGDLRYLQIIEADKRAGKRDVQIDKILDILETKTVKKEVYELNQANNQKELVEMKKMLEKILENQKK